MSKSLKRATAPARNFVARRLGQVGAAIAGVAASTAALASAGGGGLGAAALAEVSGIRADVSSILMVLVGVVFLIVAWSYFKRAK